MDGNKTLKIAQMYEALKDETQKLDQKDASSEAQNA